MNNIKELVRSKVNEMMDTVEKKSGNKNPDFYKSQREARLWTIIDGLLMTTEPSEAVLELLHTCLDGGRKSPIIEVKEGDDVLKLLDKYADVKNIWGKIQAYCEKNGLKIVGSQVAKA